MLIETRVVGSKSELLKAVHALSVTKTVIDRNVDRRAWEQIANKHQVVRVVVILLP